MVFAVVAILPIGILFFVSGFIVNLIQVVLFILVRPVSKNVFRRINKIVSELLLLELIWLVDWWGNLKIELYADDDALELMGQEHALVICNHRSDIDWLVGLTIAQRTGCLGSTLALIKKEARFLPIIGWSMWFSGYVFLERSWAKDEETLKSGFQQLEDFPMPFWLALFVEGTRFTQEKLQVAQEFASSRGLPIPRNVLIPRTKGFVAAVTHLRSFVPVIYDCTVAVPKAHPAPTLLRIFARKSSVIKLQIKRHSMEELPATTDGIAQWCKEVFVNKDAMLEVYNAKNIFGEEKHQDNGRPKTPLFVVTLWSILLLYCIVKLFQCLSILGSWEAISFSAALLVLVMIVMHTLIRSSESERSTPPSKLACSDGLKDRLLPQ